MIKSAPSVNFISRLSAECDALKAFLALLKTEQQALIDGETDLLLELSEKKIQSVNELRNLATARMDELRAQSIKIEGDGVTAWLESHAACNVPVWQDIQRLAEQVHYINRISGTLIQTKLRHNQQALSVLHNAANSAHGLYGADGQPHLPSSGRILGSV